MTLLLSPLLLATGSLSRTMMYNDEQSINSGDEMSSKYNIYAFSSRCQLLEASARGLSEYSLITVVFLNSETSTVVLTCNFLVKVISNGGDKLQGKFSCQ